MNTFWPSWKENGYFAALLTILLLSLSVLGGMKAWNAYTEHGTIGRALRDRDTITIEGQGKVTGQPTLAQVDVGLYSEGTDVPDVQQQNAKKVNAIIDAMKALGIAEKDLQTNNYSIYPRYDYAGGTQKVIGYAVSQNVDVKVRDLTKIGVVLTQVTQAGANQVNGVNFTIDDPTQLKQEARKKALDDARKKAQELADALGVKVVRVVTFSESSGTPGPMPYNFKGLSAVQSAAPVAPDIQPGTLDLTSTISVTFEIQ